MTRLAAERVTQAPRMYVVSRRLPKAVATLFSLGRCLLRHAMTLFCSVRHISGHRAAKQSPPSIAGCVNENGGTLRTRWGRFHGRGQFVLMDTWQRPAIVLYVKGESKPFLGLWEKGCSVSKSALIVQRSAQGSQEEMVSTWRGNMAICKGWTPRDLGLDTCY
jgi:hypothetical protein